MEIKSVFELLEETKKFKSVFDIMEEKPEFKWEKAPKEMGVQPVTALLEEKPVVQIAKAQVSYNISQKTGIPILEVERNLPKITKQLGIRGVPTSEEMLAAMFVFPVSAALIANPISAGIGVSKFLALTEAENYAISKLKKWEYKFAAGRGLKELLPESTVQLAKDLVDVVDFVGKGYAISKTDPKLMKMWQKFSKDVITTTSPAQQMFVSAKKLKDSGLTEVQIKEFFGLTTKQYNEAVSRGIDIRLPAIKAVELVDSPTWAKVKGLFNIKPFSKTVMMSSTGRIKPAALAITGAPDVSTKEATAFLLKEGVTQNTLNKLKPSTLKDLYYARKFGAAYGKKELVPRIPEAEKVEITKVPPEVEKLPEGVTIEAPLPSYDEHIDATTKKQADACPYTEALKKKQMELTVAKVDEPNPDILLISKWSEVLATPEQIKTIYLTLEDAKVDMTKKTEVHSAILRALTGQGDTMLLTQEQAESVISYFNNLTPRQRRGLYEITPEDIDKITPKFMEIVQGFKEVGDLTKFRDSYHMLKSINPTLVGEIYEPMTEAEVAKFEALLASAEEAKRHSDSIDHREGAHGRVWRYVDKTLTDEDKLSLGELAVAKWYQARMDEWADKLKLPPGKRRQNYITHIMEAAISKDYKENAYINPSYALTLGPMFGKGPRKAFNPYLLPRGLFNDFALIQDWRYTLKAYEHYATRTFFYDPIIHKIDFWEKFAPKEASRHILALKRRLLGRPSDIDMGINRAIRPLGKRLLESKVPGMEGIGRMLTEGNPAGNIAYYWAELTYFNYLALAPKAIIRNASQATLTIAVIGPEAFAQGWALSQTDKGKTLLKKCVTLAQRKMAPALPGLQERPARAAWLEKVVHAGLAPFIAPDKYFNTPVAFLGGYWQAKELGLPEDWAIRYGEEVVRRVQYPYSKMSASEIMQSAPGKLLGIFTTWPRNYIELGVEVMKGEPSLVLQEWEEASGKKARGEYTEEEYAKRKDAMYRYLAITAIAGVVAWRTRVKATQYIGWSALQSIPSIAAGGFVAARAPAAAAQFIWALSNAIISGELEEVEKRAKALGIEITPRFVKETTRLMSGDTTWDDYLFYLEEEAPAKYPRFRKR